MTKLEGAILTAYTGIMIGEFGDFHEYAEEIMGCGIFTHQFGSEDFAKLLKEKAKNDFMLIATNLKD